MIQMILKIINKLKKKAKENESVNDNSEDDQNDDVSSSSFKIWFIIYHKIKFEIFLFNIFLGYNKKSNLRKYFNVKI